MLISGLYVVSFASIERKNAGASEKVTKIWQAYRNNSTFLQLRSHFSSFGHHFCWLFGPIIIIIIIFGIWELSNITKLYKTTAFQHMKGFRDSSSNLCIYMTTTEQICQQKAASDKRCPPERSNTTPSNTLCFSKIPCKSNQGETR